MLKGLSHQALDLKISIIDPSNLRPEALAKL